MGLHGPLVLDTTPVEVADPELARWLDRGETVMMCMGTHYHYTESQVLAVINGFLGAIDSNSRIHFFWKLSGRVSFEGMIGELLANPRDRQRFRIVDWIDADPAAVMAHPNLVTGVRIRITNPLGAGIPQIILAQWFDLYDMATRAEYRGIGIFGNTKVAPGFETVEFGAAVARLVEPGKELDGFRTQVQQIGELCKKAGGKRAAVDKIMEVMRDIEDHA